MKNSDLNYFRELLIDWQEQLLQQPDHNINGLLDSSVYAADLLDRVSLETDRDLALRIRDRESKLIRKIKNNLKRMDNGTFGVCEICSEDIALKRLKARPVTTYCID